MRVKVGLTTQLPGLHLVNSPDKLATPSMALFWTFLLIEIYRKKYATCIIWYSLDKSYDASRSRKII